MCDNDKKAEVKKGFWAKFMDGLDKHMEAQSQKGNCCCSSQKPKAADKDNKKCC